TSSARCLAVTESLVFCGCSDGIVRVFSPVNLQFISNLPRPHCLGVQLGTHGDLGKESPDWLKQPVYPDTVGLAFDPRAGQLTCVYRDHSVYVWKLHSILDATKIYSALYHSGCVWNTQVYPEVEGGLLPASSFLTCSSDNTIRVWVPDGPAGPLSGGAATPPANGYSKDLVRVMYVGNNTQHLQDAPGADGKSGVRVLGVSPDGRHIATGDRSGNLRVFGGRSLEELVQIEAHDSEVLCLEFSPADTDRLIHVFNLENNFTLEQTLYDHSGSITALKFTGPSAGAAVSLVSCGADKSIYFRRAEQTAEGLVFSRSHHVVEKTTLYDMDLDTSRPHAAIACQGRSIQIYEVETGKLQRCLKEFSSDEGTVLKVQLDPSGCYLATSSSDRSISILDYESGETLVTLFGHSEIVTCMKFTLDCRYLITVCVFLWRLDSQMTSAMRKRLAHRKLEAGLIIANRPNSRQHSIRRETFIAGPGGQLPLPSTLEEEEQLPPETPARPLSPKRERPQDVSPDSLHLQTNGKMPMWYRKLSLDSLLGSMEMEEEEAAEQRGGRQGAERQGAEPGAGLSQDSAFCDSSAGYQQDDTDSLSQASSLGKRFDTDLRAMQADERPFLNPRLSISTRFLSRFQDRLRACPPSSLRSRIAEEPCKQVSLTLRPQSSATEAQKDQRKGDVPDKTLLTNEATAQQPPSTSTQQPPSTSLPITQQHPSTSLPSTQQHPSTSLPSTQQHPSTSLSAQPPHPSPGETPACVEENVETLLPLSSSECTTASSQPVATGDHTATGSSAPGTEHPVALVSPCQPAPLPPAEGDRRRLSGDQETTSSAAGLDSGPAPGTPQPSSRGDAGLQEVITSPDDDGEEPLGVELCQQVAQQLRQSVQRALNLHLQVESGVCASEQQQQRAAMVSVLEEALSSARDDLVAAAPRLSEGKCGRDSAPRRDPLADAQTRELLERYSDLLLHMTRRKLEQRGSE
ncbi:hypothetical protein NHX12_008636, partial [Muraenolepis orangiensis]